MEKKNKLAGKNKILTNTLLKVVHF